MNILNADKLVELRKKNGLSQEKLAEKLGVSRQAVSRWERAESSPDINNYVQLSQLYNISLDELLDTGISNQEVPVSDKPKKELLLKQIPFPFVVPVFVVFSLFGLHEGYNWFGSGHPNKLQKFPYPAIISLIYVIFGVLCHTWDTLWVIFLTIPVYYVVAALLNRK